ncbi:DUF4407 domain-containing protein [Actinomadura atramentaria]|uniref:DUF4407 domain-containing protein n=1 Tax=Actinomadura atramentaria TaxID=1990 RepID=UPI00036C1B86|nr:DUF4407 domain-containing protein [Actinomadura atramentaria]
MKGFLINLSGARPEILDKCPTERGKFEGIGGAVLITSSLAALSMWFALTTAVGLNAVVSVVPAAAWGLAIMSLDRWLVTSIPADGARRWRLAVPRILLALLLGFVVSTPLVLQIFKSEIDAQITEIKQHRADDFQARQRDGEIGKQVVSLRGQVAARQKVVDSNGDVPVDPATDPKVKALTAERDKQQQETTKLYKEWQCQLYGGANCPRKGDGPLAQASKKAYDEAQGRVNDLNAQIDARKKQLSSDDEQSKRARVDQAKQDLPKLQEQLDAAVRRQADLQRAFDAENKADGGLLIRLQALDQASGKDLTLNGARLLLFLLFLVIECLPVSVKLMQKPGNYERVLALAARREYQDARDSLSPVPTAHGGHAASSVRDIWTRDRDAPDPAAPAADAEKAAAEPERPTRVQEPWDETDPAGPRGFDVPRPAPPARPAERMNGTATRYDSAPPAEEPISPDDTALRAMDAGRADRDDDLSGDSGGIELYPDNDPY